MVPIRYDLLTGCTTTFHLGSTFNVASAGNNPSGHHWIPGDGTFTLVA